MPEFHAPKLHDLGGFSVARVLPNAYLRSVGPFVFFASLSMAMAPAALQLVAPNQIRG